MDSRASREGFARAAMSVVSHSSSRDTSTRRVSTRGDANGDRGRRAIASRDSSTAAPFELGTARALDSIDSFNDIRIRMDSTATATTSPPRDRERADDALRVALEENARLRAECEALRERQARREVEFRLELRQLAAQCASLAASAAVTSASAAATTTTSATVSSSSGVAEANAAIGERGASTSAPGTRRGTKPPTAWEVPTARPRARKGTRESANARERAMAIEVEDAATRVREERAREARRGGRGRKTEEAFAGDLSSFFFKTAKHDAPVWQTKRERNDAFAREVLRAATAASNERLLDDDDDDDDDDDARPAVESDAFDWHAPAPTVEDETEADLADSLRDDDHLVRALLRGGTDGERAAEILASRLRAVGFVEDETSP